MIQGQLSQKESGSWDFVKLIFQGDVPVKSCHCFGFHANAVNPRIHHTCKHAICFPSMHNDYGRLPMVTGTLGPLQVEVHHWSTWDDQMKTKAICHQTSPPQALPDKASANVSIQLSMPWSPGKTSRTMRRGAQNDSLIMAAAHTRFLCHKMSQEDGKGNQPIPACHTSRGVQCGMLCRELRQRRVLGIFHRGLLHLSASRSTTTKLCGRWLDFTTKSTIPWKPRQPEMNCGFLNPPLAAAFSSTYLYTVKIKPIEPRDPRHAAIYYLNMLMFVDSIQSRCLFGVLLMRLVQLSFLAAASICNPSVIPSPSMRA